MQEGSLTPFPITRKQSMKKTVMFKNAGAFEKISTWCSTCRSMILGTVAVAVPRSCRVCPLVSVPVPLSTVPVPVVVVGETVPGLVVVDLCPATGLVPGESEDRLDFPFPELGLKGRCPWGELGVTVNLKMNGTRTKNKLGEDTSIINQDKR